MAQKRTLFTRIRQFVAPTTTERIERILDKRNETIEKDLNPIAMADAKSTSLSAILQTLKSTVLTAFKGGQRGVFRDPEWDFAKVQLAITNESIFRRSVEKYVEQIRKQKWEVVGNNPNTVKYIRKRFDQMATVQNKPFESLWDEMAFNLVLYNNCIVIKRRNRKASGGKPRKTFDGYIRIPIAGYNVVDVASIKVDRDNYGNVRKWKQKPMTRTGAHMWASFSREDEESPEWPAYNVIHVKDYTASPSQYFFAMPMSIPVLADMEALRELEELTLLESVKVAVPKLHAKIGSKETPGTQEQVDDLAGTIRTITGDGILVTTERVELKDVALASPANNILTASVAYFRARVLAGLGMSGVAMGDGDSANRSTAQVISAEMQSTSAKFQRTLKRAIEFYIIRELLYELGYSETTLDDSNMVYLSIPEIDLTEKIKREAHYVNLYTNNTLTENEIRKELGRDVLSDAEREGLYLNKVQIPLAEAGAGANASAQAASNLNKSNARPSNQHGTQLAKPKVSKDYYMELWDKCLKTTDKNELFRTLNGSKLETYDITLMKMLMSEFLKDHDIQDVVGATFSAFETNLTKE